MAKRNGGIIGPSNVPNPFIAKGVWKLRDAFNYIKAGLWPSPLGYQVNNSLRFNPGSSDSLSRTQTVTGDRQKFTISMWVKRSAISGSADFFLWSSNDPGAVKYSSLYFNTDTFTYYDYDTVLTNAITTTQVFRDVSAWYHVMVAYDSTQATSSNRIKLYVNGSQATVTGTYPSLNYNSFANLSGYGTQVGLQTNGTYFSGYISEAYLIDGQALTPSSFGQTDATTGIWTPIAYTGSFGTNGFYLKFANSAALGTDSSGNGNTFTANNLTSVDQSTDTPTNNFATFLTLNDWNGKSSSQPTISEGNLKFSGSGGWLGEQVSSIAMSTGKWYWEITPTTVGLSNLTFGIVNTNNINENGTRTGSYGYASSGEKWNGATNTAYGATWTANDVIGVAFDATNGTLDFYKNGTSQGTAFTGITSTSYNAWFMTYNSVGTVNFGSPVVSSNGYTDVGGFGNFSYQPPSGYYSLCTRTLAALG